MNIYKQIFKVIKKYDTIVIARHIGADPDALGSQFALKEIILKTFPNKKVYAVGNPASRFKFFGNNEKYLSPPAAFPFSEVTSRNKNVLEMRRFFLATKVDAEIL